MSAHIIITNELAQAVGKIARSHEDDLIDSIVVSYRDEDPENVWHVETSDAENLYVVDDETGKILAQTHTTYIGGA